MTIAPGNHPLTIYQGSVFSEVITWSPGGTLADLTGYSARMQIRSRVDGQIIADLTTDNGKIAINGAAGKVTLTLTAVETAAIVTGGVYDLELLPAGENADAIRILEGVVTLSKEVTKS